MIPGTAVTVTWANGEKENGIVYKNHPFGAYVKIGVCGIECGFMYCNINLRFDNPAPFTLWQMNALLKFDANMPWNLPDPLDIHILNPDNVKNVWECYHKGWL